jgi:hypothetical protein
MTIAALLVEMIIRRLKSEPVSALGAAFHGPARSPRLRRTGTSIFGKIPRTGVLVMAQRVRFESDGAIRAVGACLGTLLHGQICATSDTVATTATSLEASRRHRRTYRQEAEL